jgi:hypothetical protein
MPAKRSPARIAISAKASPSAVAPNPTSTARTSVFQATPQPSVEIRQSSPQIERSKNLSANWLGANVPVSSRTALARIVATGKNTNTAVRATTIPSALTMKASPRHQPRPASPWHSIIRKAVTTRPAPGPMPAWLGPCAPSNSASVGQFQPATPIAKPWIVTSAIPPSPAAMSAPLASSRPNRRNSGQLAIRRGGPIGASHHAPSASTSPSAARGPCVE